MKEKMVIAVYSNSGLVGYVKGVSYKNHTFKITNSRNDAKVYSKIESVYTELDFLSEFVEKGYNFHWV